MVCRRGSDPDKMLLCDECNGGTHMFCMKPKMKTVPEGNWYCNRCVARLGLENENDTKNKKTQKRKRKFIVEEENSDASSVTSETKVTKGRQSVGSSGRSKKRLQSQEIEDVLEEDDVYQDDEIGDEDDVDDEIIVEHTLEDIDEEDLESNNDDDYVDADNDKEQTTGSNNQSDVDE